MSALFETLYSVPCYHLSILAQILHFLNYHNFVAVVVQLLCHVWLFATPWTTAHQASLSSLSPWISNFVVSLNNFNLQLLYINSSNIIAFLTNCAVHSWLLVFCMNLEVSLSFSPKEKLKGIIEIRFKNLRVDIEIWGWLTLTVLSFPNHWHNTSLHLVRSWISENLPIFY